MVRCARPCDVAVAYDARSVSHRRQRIHAAANASRTRRRSHTNDSSIAYPSFEALASAARADIVRAWKGLGYNMRAVRLHELAQAVVTQFDGTMPSEVEQLRALPGIGPYTAAAIRTFAFEIDDVAIDVNLRRVVHRLQFGLEHPPRANAT